MTTYGERLKDLRAKAGYTSVESAAKAAGVDKGTLHGYENGRPRKMQARTRGKFATKLAAIYNVSPSEVLPPIADPAGPGLQPSGKSLKVPDTPEKDELGARRESEAALLELLSPAGLAFVHSLRSFELRFSDRIGGLYEHLHGALSAFEAGGASPKSRRHSEGR